MKPAAREPQARRDPGEKNPDLASLIPQSGAVRARHRGSTARSGDGELANAWKQIMACPTLPTLDSEARLDSIESALRCALGHPQRGVCKDLRLEREDSSPEEMFSNALLTRLRASLSGLSTAGAALGAIPEGYPRWVTLIIRCVSALLPWYTRSLHAYAGAVAETATVTAAVLEDAERRSRELAR